MTPSVWECRRFGRLVVFVKQRVGGGFPTCPHCGHRSPTRQQLERHITDRCCGDLGRGK